jgi:eukaryotic-like serine/threonine-protein kinase
MIGDVLRVRYELTAQLVEGPIFTQYAARDRLLDREVCVRLAKPTFSGTREFVEALSGVIARHRSIHHPGIEEIVDVEEDGARVFLVGELSKGSVLSDRIRRLAPFSVPVSVSTAISILEPLDALHRAGLLHGDIGSHNVIIGFDGSAKLQQAGLWETYGAHPAAGAAVLAQMAPYLSPEVRGGEMPSTRSDVYAAGVVLWELLSGRKPYHGDTNAAIAAQQAILGTPSVRTMNPSVPMVLDEIVKKAMARDPEERYATAGEMLSDLRMLHDALRFGRSLTWPIGAAAAAKPKPTPEPVAPKMSALRPDDEERDEARLRRQQERDVPIWMIGSIIFFGAVLLSLIGVWALFNLNKPQLVAVPNIRGLTAHEARETLGTMKLEMRVQGREPNEKIEADKILDVNPEPGARVREGSQIGVVLSSGSRFVEVPDLRNTTLDKARSVLGNLNLELHRDVGEVSDPKIPFGQIARQTPPPKAKVERMSSVRVSVSTGPAPRATRARDNVYEYTLRLRLTDIDRRVLLRVAMQDDRGTRTILENTMQEPGTEIVLSRTGEGQEVIFFIYYDDELVKQVTQSAGETP